MKDSVDLRSAGQVGGVHLVSGPFNALLKVHTKLLHHPTDSCNISSAEEFEHISFIRMCLYELEQGLGLPGRVVGAEVLVLLHFFLQRQHLALQLAA